jgi:Fuc2NAc and GlcNAc transferase
VTTALVAALALAVALGSWGGVALVRRYALRRLLDLPNERSSHSTPTPRGGGLALTIAHLVGVILAGELGLAPTNLVIALAGGGALVATVGFLDDHGHVEPSVRLLCHGLAFGWLAWWVGGMPPVDFGWGAVDLGAAGTALMLLYGVWYLNLYNFMDGIDGIAGTQAVCMSGSAVLLLGAAHADLADAVPLLLLTAAAVGFLAWNWPPARIFMGDVGSGYVGYALGALAFWTVVAGWLTPWVWLILGGTFLVDATTTLLVRARRRESLTEAHRSHAYQRLSRYWGGHRPVTLAYAAVNTLWLGPWALVALQWPGRGATCVLIAHAPLLVAALWLGAGRAGEMVRAPR